MLNTNKKPTFATATATALYELSLYKNKRLSRNDFQPLYFRVEQVYTACKSFNNLVENSKATEEQLVGAKNLVYKALSETLQEIGKVNGFSLVMKRLDGKSEASIFYSAMHRLFIDKSSDISVEASSKRSALKSARQGLAEAKKTAKQAKGADKIKAYERVETLEEVIKKASQELKVLEKLAGNCRKSKYYASANAFAKAFIFELSLLVSEQATQSPEAIEKERKARNKSTADARKGSGKNKDATKGKPANEKPASKGKGKQASKDANEKAA